MNRLFILIFTLVIFCDFSPAQKLESSDKKLESNFGSGNLNKSSNALNLANETLIIINETKSGHDFKILNERLDTLPSDKEVVSSSSSSSNRRQSRQLARQQQSLNNKESTERLQSLILGGKPGVDYPNFVRPPGTKFSCRKMEYGGMFADPETKCQAYHVCYNRRMDTFLCPTGTLFNQAIMACDFWYNVNCDRAPEFYDMNFQLYQPYQPKTTLRPRSNIQPPARPSQPVPTVVAAPSTTPFTLVRPFNPSSSSTVSPPSFTSTRRPAGGGITRSRSLPSPTPSTAPSTTSTTTTSTTTATPRTRKLTTPRLRSATQRTRPPTRPMPPGMDVDDRDWVFAWLQQGNGTRADKQLLPELFGSSSNQPKVEKKMEPENYPLLSFTELDTNHKTDSAFSFSHDLNPFDSSYGFSVNHNPGNPRQPATLATSSLLQGAKQSSDKLRLIPLQESSNHPSPWLFPKDPQLFSS